MRLSKRFEELLKKASRQFHWKIDRDECIRTREKQGRREMCPIEAAYVASGRPLMDGDIRRHAEDVAPRVGLRSRTQMVMDAADGTPNPLHPLLFSCAGMRKQGAVRKRLLSILDLTEPKSERAR